MTVYPENDSAIFYRTRDRYGELSNMHGDFPILYRDREWKSSEALYQALRFPDREDIHEEINAQTNAFMAKRKAYEFIKLTRDDWHDVKVETMEMVLRLKYNQHPVRVGSVLDLTLGSEIVEKSKNDSFWGAIPDGNGNLVGENVLGMLWMVIRFER
jgi:N-glycosidase YbiA